jgi:hypothetical protein
VTSDWNSNNPNPTTVYRGPLRIRFINNQWTGIGLPNPYLYVPLNANEHLCIEVIVWSAINGPTNFYYPKASGTLQRAFRNGWVTNQTQPPLTGSSGCRMGFVINDGNISVAGDSCMSSTNTPLRASASTWPQLGAPLSLNLQGAVATRPAFFVIGTKLVAFDLNVAGAPGCILWNNPLIGVPTVTDAAGAAVLNTTVPKNSTPGTIFGHWLVLDGAANAGGMTTSDSMTIIIGS